MAHTKAGGSTRNGRDSNPKYLGIKLNDGQTARPGMVIVRQRGTKIEAGKNVKVGHDHTLYAMVSGKVLFRSRRKTNFDGQIVRKKVVDVLLPADSEGRCKKDPSFKGHSCIYSSAYYSASTTTKILPKDSPIATGMANSPSSLIGFSSLIASTGSSVALAISATSTPS